MDKLKAFLNHERYQTLSVVICCCLLVWLYSCESTTRSPVDPGTKVTRNQLNAEVDYYLARAEIAYKDLDRQDIIKQRLTDAAAIAIQNGQVNVLGLLIANIGILGIGASVDNVRKRKEIKRLQNNAG